MHITYLLINFFTVIICFIYSFHPKIKFNRYFGAFLKSSILVGTVFVLWDAWFTKKGVWWFNDQFLLGIRILRLPVEELMFFICIPFSCVFTYFCLTKFFKWNINPTLERIYVLISVVFYAVLGIVFHHHIYTAFTFMSLSISLLVLYYALGIRWIAQATVIYIILLPGFLIVNGLLTGTALPAAIVNYNPADFMGIRILTIPVEDAFYGFELILWNLYFFKKFAKKIILKRDDFCKK